MQMYCKLYGLAVLLATFIPKGNAQQLKEVIKRSEVETHIRFLASDELKGRDTGSPELDIAARYIAAQMQSYGVEPVEGEGSYFQTVPLLLQKPAQNASLTYEQQSLQILEDLLVLQGQDGELEAESVFLDFGTEEDFKNNDIEGKIVVTKAGYPDSKSSYSAIAEGQEKLKMVQEYGGKGLVELYKSSQMPWNLLNRYMNAERLTMGQNSAEDQAMPYFLINDAKGQHLDVLSATQPKLRLSIKGKIDRQVSTYNVIGKVEGTDPKLKDEYVLLSAHYDHVGVAEGKNLEDSVYNGARDNAIGTTALISAARYFGQHPPKRSVVLLALTAEEKGLLGSQWYAEHPLVPMEQVVFNLNSDGAGYNDTTRITVIGLGRTSADKAFKEAAQAVGLEAMADPVPEQNLFDRSDNVNFAKVGVPAVTFSAGFTAFDAEIMRYYHQLADEAESLNFSYVEKLCEAYVLAADKIANSSQSPFWVEGDVYEEAGKTLYGRE